MEAAGDSLVDLCKSDFSSFPKDTGRIILSFSISMIISKFDCFIDQVTVIEEPILTIPYNLRWSFDKGVRGDGGTGGQNPTIGNVTKRDFRTFSFNLLAVDMARVECPAELVIKTRSNQTLVELFPGGNDTNQEE